MSKKKITLANLAEKLSYSESTISRVLNGKGDKYRINKKTQELIRAEAEKLDYVPNLMARGLRTDTSMMIGVIIPDISNPFFSSISKTIEQISRKNNYSIFLCDSQEDESIELQSINTMLRRNVDGIVIAPVGLSPVNVEKIQNEGIPVVIIDRYFQNSSLPYISSDNYQGAYDAVKYIIERGHKRIAIIKGTEGTVPNEERLRGYTDALLDNKIDIDESLIIGDSFGEQNGYLEAKILLQSKNRPTAIFAVSNLISLGALRACAEADMEIPRDISIVAFDEQPYSQFLKTPMTTVKQNKNEIAYAAMKILFQQIDSKQVFKSQSILLPTELIIRKSVKNITDKNI